MGRRSIKHSALGASVPRQYATLVGAPHTENPSLTWLTTRFLKQQLVSTT